MDDKESVCFLHYRFALNYVSLRFIIFYNSIGALTYRNDLDFLDFELLKPFEFISRQGQQRSLSVQLSRAPEANVAWNKDLRT